MTDPLRVILEVGPKRRVVAGATDWPGLDRWGTSDENEDTVVWGTSDENEDTVVWGTSAPEDVVWDCNEPSCDGGH